MRIDLFASDNLRLGGRQLSRRVELRRLSELDRVQGKVSPSVIIGPARELAAISPQVIERIKPEGVRVIVTEAVPGSPMPRFSREVIHCTLPVLDEREEWRILSSFINNAVDLLSLQNSARRTQHDLEELTRIGVLLSSEKDTDKLLELILTKSREITRCDAGSLFMVEETRGERRLSFKLAQNDSVAVSLRKMTIPLNNQSLVGYAVLSGQPLVIHNAYEIDPDEPYSFARWLDKKNNYRTISMLVVPLKNLKEEVVGALQLINRKRDFRIRLTDPLAAMVSVLPFDAHSIDMVSSLASLAAVTLEKNMLYEAIQNLFEGFVKASVKAIESRDPTTSGHSERVARLTVRLAEVVDRVDGGAFANVRFSRDELRELRYASLLHDFGKVGVRENVLVKAKKLYPQHMEVIQMRAAFIKAAIRLKTTQEQFDFVLKNGRDEFERRRAFFDGEAEGALKSLEDDLNLILQANEPNILPQTASSRLIDMAEKFYVNMDGERLKLVDPEEVRVLSIPRGTLTEEERLEIESHVTHTFYFLQTIPWTKELLRVPEIAYKHHEKLNQSGYPRRLPGQEIPLQSRMMTICDIYDALTAADRPYKKAASTELAIDIIRGDMQRGMLDPELVGAFVEARVFDVLKESLP